MGATKSFMEVVVVSKLSIYLTVEVNGNGDCSSNGEGTESSSNGT